MNRLLEIDYSQYMLVDDEMLEELSSIIMGNIDKGVDTGWPVLIALFGLGALIYVISLFVPRK